MALTSPPSNFSINHGDIQLTNTENHICSLLNDFCLLYNHDKQDADKLVLRITGGWVRDRLLGKESHDIDIAINNLSGEQFAYQLQTYIAENHNKYKDILHDSAKMHKIDKNPEKSKHLETVTTKLFGESIDFVNLRHEDYTNVDSRIPTIVEFGTAAQDALRRDATLNALFYNLYTRKIEDFTEKGLDDLQAGILRTPLEPLKTFLDDPLRVLRLIRFAAQFGFKIDDSVFQIMKNDELVKQSLLRKVSRERIGIEFGKLLTSQYPVLGLKIINDAKLFDIILSIENIENGEYLDEFFKGNFPVEFQKDLKLLNDIYLDLSTKPESDLTRLEHVLLNLLDPKQFLSKSDSNKYLQKLFYLAFIFKNFTKYVPEDYQVSSCGSLSSNSGKQKGNSNKKVKSVYPIEHIIKEAFHFNKSDADIVNKVIVYNKSNCEYYFDSDAFLKKSIIGFNVIKPVLHPEYWELSLLLNYVSQYHSNKSKRFSDIYDYIELNGLKEAYNIKQIIDGKEVCKILRTKPGKWLKDVNDKVFQWQLDYRGSPDTIKEDCVKFIQTLEQ